MTARPLYFDCSPGMAASLTPDLLALCPALEIAMESTERETMIARLVEREIIVLGKTWLGGEDLVRAKRLRGRRTTHDCRGRRPHLSRSHRV